MDKKRKSGGQRTRHLGKIKLAITAGAVTMTLGFWTMFSQQADQQAALAAADPQGSVDPNVQLGLQPLPTLVPRSSSRLRSNLPTAKTNENSAITQLNQSFRFLLGGSQPVQSRPRTITSTRSSR